MFKNNQIKVLVLILVLLTVSYCKNKNQHDYSVNKDQVFNQGKAIVTQNCMTCHAPNIAENNKIAPSLVDVKTTYLKHYNTEESFVSNMTSFLMRPNATISKMPKAVEAYNVMPNLGMSQQDYKAAAYYIFNVSLEKPSELNKEAEVLSHDKIEQDYLNKGMNIALSTKAVLGKNLLTAIKTKGAENALEFCNKKVVFLTDSMSNNLNAKIKRVSDKNRNPNNKASDLELEYIDLAKNELAKTGEVTPKTFDIDNEVVGYYPIITNNMCLQCHGKRESDISMATLSKLDSLYPNDKATGYSSNELRGIWVVTMDK